MEKFVRAFWALCGTHGTGRTVAISTRAFRALVPGGVARRAKAKPADTLANQGGSKDSASPLAPRTHAWEARSRPR